MNHIQLQGIIDALSESASIEQKFIVVEALTAALKKELPPGTSDRKKRAIFSKATRYKLVNWLTSFFLELSSLEEHEVDNYAHVCMELYSVLETVGHKL